jgi:hypothetical protein
MCRSAAESWGLGHLGGVLKYDSCDSCDRCCLLDAVPARLAFGAGDTATQRHRGVEPPGVA